MGRNYIRKTNRQSWQESDMKKAIKEVIYNNLQIGSAAEVYSVPKTTLFRRVQEAKKDNNIDKASKKSNNKIKKFYIICSILNYKNICLNCRIRSIQNSIFRTSRK